MNFVMITCIIPARMASSRLYGKALSDVNGIPMIQQVYNRAVESESFDKIFISTGDEEIIKNVNVPVIYTPQECPTCTDRVSYASDFIKSDLIVNLQGDEPILEPSVISGFVKQSLNSSYLVNGAYCDMPEHEQSDPNRVKAIVSGDQIIDLKRNSQSTFKQLGLMSYEQNTLKRFREFPTEGMTELDLKRFIDNKISIGGIKVTTNSLSVDTIEDLDKVRIKLTK
jgi:3-deoxy-manno-octulosonate cytidylyltransferase (CMP-KDO synthetase)